MGNSAKSSQTKRASSRGGQAMQSGADYQARVAAWLAVRSLAERSIAEKIDCPNAFFVESLFCEAPVAVDDTIAESNDGDVSYWQAKHTINFSEAPSSDFRKTIDQFVDQFVAGKSGTSRFERPLDSQRDRFILVTSSSASGTITGTIRKALKKLAAVPIGMSRTKYLTTTERSYIAKIEKAIRARFKLLKFSPDAADLQTILSLTRIVILDLDDDQTDYEYCEDLLTQLVVSSPQQAKAALSILFQKSMTYAKQGTGASLSGLQDLLFLANIEIKARPSFQADVEKLKAYTTSVLSRLKLHSHFIHRGIPIKLKRGCDKELLDFAQTRSCLVIGEPGIGKSAELFELSKQLDDAGHNVFLIALDTLDCSSTSSLKTELDGLEHDLPEILRNWKGIKPGIFLVDSLDSAKSEPSQRIIRETIEAILKHCPQWHVVASVRKYDLRYGFGFSKIFAGIPNASFNDPDFSNVVHINIPRLEDSDLDQLASDNPDFGAVLSNATSSLKDLLKVPFNLHLLFEILGGDTPASELHAVRSQVELLEKFWCKRVVGTDIGVTNVRELALKNVVNEMMKVKSLRADRLKVFSDSALSQTLPHLLSCDVLNYWRYKSQTVPDQRFVTFGHNLLFDFTVSKVWLEADCAQLTIQLHNDRQIALFARNALCFYFQSIWLADIEMFWRDTLKIESDPAVTNLAKTAPPAVAAVSASTISDLEPLVLMLDNPTETIYAKKILRHLTRALLADGQRGPLWQRKQLWLSFVLEISKNADRHVLFEATSLLRELYV